jgi:hypothetical protein
LCQRSHSLFSAWRELLSASTTDEAEDHNGEHELAQATTIERVMRDTGGNIARTA